MHEKILRGKGERREREWGSCAEARADPTEVFLVWALNPTPVALKDRMRLLLTFQMELYLQFKTKVKYIIKEW